MLKETRQLEFKENISNYKDLNRELVAFLNDIGGEVLVGINDEGEVIGIEESLLEKYLDEIPSSIFNSISPYCHPVISVKNFQGKQVLSIVVFPSGKRPYFLKSKGIPSGVYIRIGTHSMPATEAIIEDLQRSNTKDSYDLTTFKNCSLEDFDELVLKAHYGSMPSQEKLVADSVIRYDHLANQFSPTVSGILFFHKKPNSIIDGAEILFTKFNGSDYSKVLRTKDYTGPATQMINEVLHDIKNEILVSLKSIKSQKIHAKLLIPENVLRECIVNAVIHRKYYLKDSIKIALFNDRLEIYSPGNFPGPITDFHAGVSYSRNPHLRQLARNIGLVEKRGIGLPLIFNECKKFNLPEPQIIEQTGDFVKVIFRLNKEEKNNSLDINKTHTNFLEFFKEKETFTLTQIADYLGCSKNTAAKKLEPFMNKSIKRVGQGRATYYVWI